MNRTLLRTTVFPSILLMVLMVFVGCKFGQDKPADMTDVKAAAAHVISQFEAGDFSHIYQESAPSFKQVGTESQFVAQFQQTRKKTGLLKNPKELNSEVRGQNTYQLTYRMENDHFTSDIHLTLVRSTDGKVMLAGLHEHNDPKN